MKNNKLIIAFSIALISIIGFAFYRGTYARYVSNANGITTVFIAEPAYDETFKALSISLTDLQPGDIVSYDFNVTNKNTHGKISEVSLDYFVEIETSNNFPLRYTLVKNNTDELLNGSLISETQSFPHSNETIDNYTLTISWPDEEYAGDQDYYYNSEWADLIEKVTIIINVSQKIS